MKEEDILNNHITDYINSKINDYITHVEERKCQRCGDTRMYDIALNCQPSEYGGDMFEAPIFEMVTLCKKCHNELNKWLNIPCHDPL